MALTKISNPSLSAITSLPASIPTGSLTLISTQTASASASISFTSGIDSTYDSYVFKFINIHPSVDGANFTFNGSIDSGSNYNVIKTSTFFWSYHNESDTNTALEYNPSNDLAQSTAFNLIGSGTGFDNDENLCGTLQLFNPSSITYVKHWISTAQETEKTGYSVNDFTAGYFNTTSAINAIRFQMETGNIDDGIIKMYGVS